MQNRFKNRIMAAVMTAVLSLGTVAAPVAAIAKDANYPGDAKKAIGRYQVTAVANGSTNGTLALTRLTTYGKTLKSVRIGAKTTATGANAGTYIVNVVRATAFKNSTATYVVLPETITKIWGGAFKGSKAQTLTVSIKSEKLTKGRVKNMFQGFKGSKIIVKVPASKYNYYKKTVFTKANTGAKVNVTVIKAK